VEKLADIILVADFFNRDILILCKGDESVGKMSDALIRDQWCVHIGVVGSQNGRPTSQECRSTVTF
jgi:hypothetical protein